jgi:hypothetical protein
MTAATVATTAMNHDAYFAQYDAGRVPVTVCCCLGLRVDRQCARGCPDAEWRPWFRANVRLNVIDVRQAVLDAVNATSRPETREERTRRLTRERVRRHRARKKENKNGQ